LAENPLDRIEILIGQAALGRLRGSAVMVAGLGGVGSAAAEALARSGIGRLILVDADVVTPSNLNRQLVASSQAMGKHKADAMSKRIAEVAPGCRAEPLILFLDKENIPGILKETKPDYVVDAVDNVSAKLFLAVSCSGMGIPLISCMGTGNKLDPTRFRVSDIYKTDICPLARVMRRELRRKGVPSLRVVWSDEPPLLPARAGERGDPAAGRGRTAVGSVSFVPPVAGMIAAGEAIRDLMRPCGERGQKPHYD
jgi:tRNA A37 threonylcarbamoyladenosine dehydratase